MRSSSHCVPADQENLAWPFILILLAVLTPCVGILWMMWAALESERLAIHQRLAESYDSQLKLVRAKFMEASIDRLEKLDGMIDPQTSLESFRRSIASKLVDGLVVLDCDGNAAFPREAVSATIDSLARDADWNAAQQFEFKQSNLPGAIAAYQRVREQTTDESSAGRVEQAAARCLLKLNRRSEAADELEKLIKRSNALDPHGRSLSLDAGLMLLDLYEKDSDKRKDVLHRLAELLSEPTSESFTASQRRFVIRRLLDFGQADEHKDVWNAELLAAESVTEFSTMIDGGERHSDWNSQRWSAQTPSKRAIAIFRRSTLDAEVERIVQELNLLDSGEFRICATSEMEFDPDSKEISSKSASLQSFMPGWYLSLTPKPIEPGSAASGRGTYYAWITAGLIGLTIALTSLVYRLLQRQSRVARLKNDLVATVSHELKTPLSSIRLLVDTLIEKRSIQSSTTPSAELELECQTREYLALIADENERLTRLVDNFLTYSRLNSGRQTLHRDRIDLRDAIETTRNRLRESFDAKGIQLTVNASSPLPMLGDMDAMVMAIDNLLSNALKYSETDTHVEVTGEQNGHQILVQIRDQGRGLSPSEYKRVFERFYQVDQKLSRTEAGCGLGLSIVQSIVQAHSGAVSVVSRPGQGSIFTMTLPSDFSCKETNSARDYQEPSS